MLAQLERTKYLSIFLVTSFSRKEHLHIRTYPICHKNDMVSGAKMD